MRAAPPADAPGAGTPAGAQALKEHARAHARRRRRKTTLAVIIIAAAIGGVLAGTGALSGRGPAARGGPSRPASPPAHTASLPAHTAPLPAHTGRVTGYIGPCETLEAGLPYAAGTVTALRGRETWKPVGNGQGTYYVPQLPAAYGVAARQHVGQNQKFSFDLAPGQYVLVARYDHGAPTTYFNVTIVAGRVLHQDIPNGCK